MVLQQLINALVFGSELTLFTLGLSLAWGTLDVLDLGHGAVFVLAGFLAYILTARSGLSFVVALVVATASAGSVTAIFELVSVRWIRNRARGKRQARLSVLVAGIGLATILNQIVVNQTAAASFGILPTSFAVHVYRVGSVVVTNIEIIIVAVAVVASVLLDQWVRRSRHGRAVRAVAYDPAISGLLGINVNVLATATMFFAGALAGLAGVLLAVNLGGGEDITAGQTYLLTGFAIVIVGGVGNVRGVVTAAYLIALVETAIVAYGPAQWRDGVAFVLIGVVLVLRPQGLFVRGRFQRV